MSGLPHPRGHRHLPRRHPLRPSQLRAAAAAGHREDQLRALVREGVPARAQQQRVRECSQHKSCVQQVDIIQGELKGGIN